MYIIVVTFATVTSCDVLFGLLIWILSNFFAESHIQLCFKSAFLFFVAVKGKVSKIGKVLDLTIYDMFHIIQMGISFSYLKTRIK